MIYLPSESLLIARYFVKYATSAEGQHWIPTQIRSYNLEKSIYALHVPPRVPRFWVVEAFSVACDFLKQLCDKYHILRYVTVVRVKALAL
jgi:hypothetical protein